MNVSRSATKLFLSNVGTAILLFGGTAYFARVLGGEQFAPFILFQGLLGLLSIPADLGVRGGAEKRISEGRDAPEILGTAVILKLVLVIFIGVIVFLFRLPINKYIGADISIILVLTLIVREFGLLNIAVIRGELQVGRTATVSFIRYAGWVLFGVILVRAGYGVQGPVYGLFAGNVIMLIWSVYRKKTNLGYPSVGGVVSLLSYARYNVISQIGGYTYNWIDVVILGLFVPSNHVTAYEVAWRVSMLIMTFTAAIADTIFPQVSAWDAQDVQREIKQLIPHMVATTTFVSIPATFGVVLYAEAVLKFVFAPEFTIASLVLIILMMEKILQSIHIVVGKALQAIGGVASAAVATIISLVVNIVLNLVLIPQFGLNGAGIATTISFGLNALLHVYYFNQFVTLHLPWRRLSLSVIASIIMTGCLLIINQFMVVNNLVTLVGSIVIGILVYTMIMMCSESVRATLNYIISV